MRSDKRASVKVTAAVIGAGAALTLGALGIAIGQGAGTAAAKSASMTVGATMTETPPSAVPATSMAVPAIKGPAPLPTEEQAAE